MIEEQAIVTKIVEGQVWIKRLQNGACGSCAQQASCGSATLGKLLPMREFVVECAMAVRAGDRVVVAIDDAHLLSTSLLLYGMPLLFMLLVVGLSSLILDANLVDDWLPEIALSALLLAFWLINRCQALFLLYYCLKPQIVRKMVSGER